MQPKDEHLMYSTLSRTNGCTLAHAFVYLIALLLDMTGVSSGGSGVRAHLIPESRELKANGELRIFSSGVEPGGSTFHPPSCENDLA